MSAHVLAILNHPDSGLGRFGDWLTDAGLEVDLRAGKDGVPDSLDGLDGLIMLGGGFMPDDDETGPWLPDERALATQAIDADLPTLGICLGGQLLALVAGGEVRADFGEIERGATCISLTEAAADDAVFGALPQTFDAIENHRDRITALPPEAVHLAYSQACDNQAFRLGERVWGLQFHPEASAANVARWNTDKVTADGFDHAELVQRAEHAEPDSAVACRRLADAFAAVVRG